MGYRSDWHIIICGEPQKLIELLAWMKEFVEANKEEEKSSMGWTCGGLMEEILESKEENFSYGELAFWGNGWKCYTPWDAVVQDILQKARDELGLDAAYAKIGEEYGDIETDHGDEVYIGIIREMDVETPRKQYQWPPLKEDKNGQLEMTIDDRA